MMTTEVPEVRKAHPLQSVYALQNFRLSVSRVQRQCPPSVDTHLVGSCLTLSALLVSARTWHGRCHLLAATLTKTESRRVGGVDGSSLNSVVLSWIKCPIHASVLDFKMSRMGIPGYVPDWPSANTMGCECRGPEGDLEWRENGDATAVRGSQR